MLIQNLLYFTKGDNKLLVMKREKLSLSMLLKEVVDETILTHNQFTVAYKGEEYLTINADYNALKQVFRILLDNSIKFSTPPGEILIQAEQKDRGTLGCKHKRVSIIRRRLQLLSVQDFYKKESLSGIYVKFLLRFINFACWI